MATGFTTAADIEMIKKALAAKAARSEEALRLDAMIDAHADANSQRLFDFLADEAENNSGDVMNTSGSLVASPGCSPASMLFGGDVHTPPNNGLTLSHISNPVTLKTFADGAFASLATALETGPSGIVDDETATDLAAAAARTEEQARIDAMITSTHQANLDRIMSFGVDSSFEVSEVLEAGGSASDDEDSGW